MTQEHLHVGVCTTGKRRQKKQLYKKPSEISVRTAAPTFHLSPTSSAPRFPPAALMVAPFIFLLLCLFPTTVLEKRLESKGNIRNSPETLISWRAKTQHHV